MNIILTMFLSSNVLFLLFLILNAFYKYLFSPRSKYNILKTVLILAVIPWAFVKSLVMRFFNFKNSSLELIINGKFPTIMVTSNGRYINKAYRYNLIIICIWFSMAAAIFLWYAWKQFVYRHIVLGLAKEAVSAETMSILNKYQTKLALKKKIRIYNCKEDIPPFTIGIIKPVIIIPYIKDICNQEAVIYHELCHIKRHDGLIRFLRLIAVGIYWFNPFNYILDTFLESNCEISCDEIVTREMDQTQRRNYAHLIVDMAVSSDYISNAHVIPFSLSLKNNSIKERVEYIMRKRTNRYRYSMLIAIGLTVFSCIPVYAYQGPSTVIWENTIDEDIFLKSSNQTVVFEEIGKNPIYPLEIQPLLYNEQFTDKNGNIYEVRDNDSRAKCQHDYVDGVYQKHTKNSDGSCLSKSYNAQRCSKCGNLRLGSLISEIKYTTCPH